MTKCIETTGKTKEDAIEKALLQLGLEREDVSVELLEMSRPGFLGIGATPAKVRVSYEAPDEAPKQEKKPEQKNDKRSRKPEKEGRSARQEEKPAAPAPAKSTEPAEGEKAEKTKAFLQGLFEKMGVEAESILTKGEDGAIDVELRGEDMGALIGRRGETLDAIQHLANYAVNHGEGGRTRINVDAENYRAKRTESLKHLAEKVAAKVVKYRRNITLEPMNAYERHVIHTTLQDYASVTTFSTGNEPNRRVVVAYERGGKGDFAEPRRDDRKPRHSGSRRGAPRSRAPKAEAPEVAPVEKKPVDKTVKEWA